MATPQDVLNGLAVAIDQSGKLPTSTNYIPFRLDENGAQGDVSLPAVELEVIESIRNNKHNTDFVGYATDSSGNHIGYIYKSLFEMSVQIDVWTAEGGGYDPRTLGTGVRNALYRYDSHKYGRQWKADGSGGTVPGEALPDGNGGWVNEIYYLAVDTELPQDDLSMTPALRRWRCVVDVWFYDILDTSQEYGAENYVATVNVPDDGSATSGSDVDIVLDATPTTSSPADDY